MIRRVALLGIALGMAASCETQRTVPIAPDVGSEMQLLRQLELDFAGFAPPDAAAIRTKSISRKLSNISYDDAWQGALAVGMQWGFIASASKETGVLICVALPVPAISQASARPDPYRLAPPAICLQQRGGDLFLHANWDVRYYHAVKGGPALVLADTSQQTIAAIFFDMVEEQARSSNRWPWLHANAMR